MSPQTPSLRVGIDGFNLAIPRGTGVATYARSLSHCLGELGHPVDVLYGLNIASKADPVLREVMFFDLLESERGRKPPKFPSVKWTIDRAHSATGITATEIPLTGRTIPTQLSHRLPHYDRIYNAQDLFGMAGRFFRDFQTLRHRAPRQPAGNHALDLPGADPGGRQQEHLYHPRPSAAALALHDAG